MTNRTSSLTIDPDGIETFYFAPKPTKAGVTLPTDLGAVEVSVDLGETWVTLTLSEDDEGNPAYPWVLAGSHVSPLPLAVQSQAKAGQNIGLKRIIDNPERPTSSFIIYCER